MTPLTRVILLTPVARAIELGWSHDLDNRRARKHFHFYAPLATKRYHKDTTLVVHLFNLNSALYTIGDLTTQREEIVIERIEEASK